MTTQIILEFPSDLPEEALRDPEILKEGKIAIILKILRKEAISQDRAAELLEIDREALLDLMEKYDRSGIDTGTQKLEDVTTATAGSWKDLLDCQTFEQEVYKSRLHHTRPEVRL